MRHKTISIPAKKMSEEQILEKLALARNSKASNVEEAISIYKDIILQEPDLLDARLELSGIYMFAEQYEDAYPHLKAALNLQSDSGKLWCFFGRCLYKLLYCEAALMAFNKAEELSFDTIAMQLDKAMSLMVLNRFDEGMALIEHLLEKHPEDNNILQAKSVLAAMMGKVDLASESLMEILKTLPGEPSVLYKLSEMDRLPECEYQLCSPEHEIFKNRKLSWHDRTFLYYSRAIEDHRRKQYDSAFAGFNDANKIIREKFDFDRQNLVTRTDLHKQFYTRELIESFKGKGSDSSQPVFIIGMPRSGTTLVEQILSSHSEVGAAGEVAYMAKIESSLVKVSSEGSTSYPQSMEAIDPLALKDFASQYLSHLERCTIKSGRYITDKMPTNFLNLGLISIMFPNARIIHIKRDPIDTCLSCYFKRFVDFKNLSFTFDLEDLGFFYNEYLRLMEHWKNVLQGKFIEVQYEDLVANQKDVTEIMLSYLDLDWDENCMKFYENQRGVTTSSLHQVRQPIYKGAVGRWRSYEKHIGPLIDVLNQ